MSFRGNQNDSIPVFTKKLKKLKIKVNNTNRLEDSVNRIISIENNIKLKNEENAKKLEEIKKYGIEDIDSSISEDTNINSSFSIDKSISSINTSISISNSNFS